jgi:hypothetical protein
VRSTFPNPARGRSFRAAFLAFRIGGGGHGAQRPLAMTKYRPPPNFFGSARRYLKAAKTNAPIRTTVCRLPGVTSNISEPKGALTQNKARRISDISTAIHIPVCSKLIQQGVAHRLPLAVLFQQIIEGLDRQGV